MKPEPHQPPAPLRALVLAWCLVLLAAGLEVIWALALTEADGLSRPGWAVGGIAVAIISLIMLTMALRTLPLSTAYAVWVGMGTVGVALTGVLVLGEPLTLPRAGCLALIVAGVIGLTLTDTPLNSTQPSLGTGKANGVHEHQGSGER